ncbi:MAG: hypothetical protein H7Z42_17490 [Roseiflexaceae bacterium]|nr:hypothetical protein [Roseiflexaceae bacterium]
MSLLLVFLGVFSTGLYTHAFQIGLALSDPLFSMSLLMVFADPEPLANLTATINKFVNTAKGIGRPAAVLSFIVVALMWVFSGALPGIVGEHKGAITKVICGLMLLSLAPDLAALFMPGDGA